LPVVRQNRAVALSYYACAPLAWLWVPAAILGFIALLISPQDESRRAERLAIAVLLVEFSLLVAIVLVTWFRAAMLLRHTTHCGSRRTATLLLFLPLSWGLLFGLCAVIPLMLLYLSLVVLSFR